MNNSLFTKKMFKNNTNFFNKTFREKNGNHNINFPNNIYSDIL